MKLTKEQAIINHRKMWNWTADKTEERGKKVLEPEYFRKNQIADSVENYCYCCEFAKQFKCISGSIPWTCTLCPIDWDSKDSCPCCHPAYIGKGKGLYARWIDSRSTVTSIQLAREIAYLPEKPNGEIIRAAFKEVENYPDADELDFYMALTDSGFTVKDVRECMGDETADHMQQFCKEHGLI